MKIENPCKTNLRFDETDYGIGISSVIATVRIKKTNLETLLRESFFVLVKVYFYKKLQSVPKNIQYMPK